MTKMMPGQEPYTEDETKRLYALVHDAATGDPGERDEPTPTDEPYEGWSNRATWHASLILHNEYDAYRNLHDPARLAVLREDPWSPTRWVEALEWAWRSVPAALRRATAAMPGRIDWDEIARECATEVSES